MKHKLSTVLVPDFPNFYMLFEVETDASMVGMGSILSQKGRPIEFIVRNLMKHNKSGQSFSKTYMLM